MSAIVYDIDPVHSSAHFSVRHMMISNVKGEFTKLSGRVTYDADNPGASQVEATIDVASLHTRDEQRARIAAGRGECRHRPIEQTPDDELVEACGDDAHTAAACARGALERNQLAHPSSSPT